MRPDSARDPVAGPDSGPEPPFPIRLSGPVIRGFGRGSKELGIPTANIPPEGLAHQADLQTGVYYGAVALDPAGFSLDPAAPRPTILPAVLSIGYNPFYKNTVRSVEIHIMAPLSAEPAHQDQFFKLPDFYGTRLNLLILGYIRPEFDYVSLEALVDDIRTDCQVARQSLARPAYACFLADALSDGVSADVLEARQWLVSF